MGMGAAPVQREGEKTYKPSLLVLGNCAKQSGCLIIFFPALSLPVLPGGP